MGGNRSMEVQEYEYDTRHVPVRLKGPWVVQGAGTGLGRGSSLGGDMSAKVDRSLGGYNNRMAFYANVLQ